MGCSHNITAISVAILLTASINVQAGDYYPPRQAEDTPEVTVVEFGTGWYLRGDVGFTAINVDPGFTINNIGMGGDFDQAYSFEIGAGYQVNNYLRFDGTIEHMINLGLNDRTTIGCDAGVGGICSETQSISVGATAVMLNAYFDLGTFSNITPYVGGGIGGAYMSWGDYTLTGTCTVVSAGDCQNGQALYTGTYTGNAEWKPAAALMAGFTYDLTQNLKFDVGYKYTFIDGGSAADNIPDGNGGFSDLNYDPLNIHQVRLGFRYEIW